jgi:hypothetical protein
MRLMLVIALSVNAFLALSLLFFMRTRKAYPGFGLWTAGVCLLAVGYLFLCARGSIPNALSILVVNVAFPLGMVFHLAGLRRFLGLAPMSPVWYLLPAGAGCMAVILFYGYDSERLRALSLSIAVSALHFAMALLILRGPTKPRSLFYGVIGVFLAFGGLIILFRAVWALTVQEFHVLLDAPVQFAFFVSAIVLQLGENLAFIMLNSERLEKELVEAERSLRTTVQDLQKALGEIRTLRCMLPICSNCKKIRDDQGYWQAVDHYIQDHSEITFSHSICPDCLQELYPDFANSILQKKP